MGGLSKKYAYQEEPPYTTPDAVNVRPERIDTRRMSGGTRPGVAKQYYQELGGGSPVNLLSSVSHITSGGGVWSDTFGGIAIDTSIWSQAGFLAANGMPRHGTDSGGNVWSNVNEQRAMVRSVLPINVSSPYYIDMTIYPPLYTGSSWAYYRIFARMDDTAPNATTSGIIAELRLRSVSFSMLEYEGGLYVNGTLSTSFPNSLVPSVSITFTVEINGNTVKVQLNGTQLLGSGVTVASHGTNTRMGLGLGNTSNAAGTKVLKYRVRQQQSSIARNTVIVAGSNGQLYYDSNGSMTAVGASNELTSNHFLAAAERQGKLYIANYDVNNASAKPKIYDPSTNTVSDWTATEGTTPTQCKLICRYRDRMVLASQNTAPHLWFMSRLGDPLDWDYGQLANGDTASAVSSALSDAGDIGEEITAMIPFRDDYLVFGCTDSLWVLRGDPAFGGQIDNLSRNAGIVDKFALCTTPTSELVYLSKDGIYVLPGNVGSANVEPVRMSRTVLPNDLLNIDTMQYQVSMAFDVEFSGILIALSSAESGVKLHYWIDWDTKGIWPVTYPPGYEPTMQYFVATPVVRGVLYGCRDGYIRRQDISNLTDDGEPIASYVQYGPFRCGGTEFHDGGIFAVTGTIASGLGDIRWTAQTAPSIQGVVLNPSLTASGVWSADAILSSHGRQYTVRPRIRGGAGMIKIENGTDGEPWGIEGVHVEVGRMGRQRLA